MILTNHSSAMLALLGISIFMYGMSLASDALQKLTSNNIRDLLTAISDKPIIGVAAGMVMTVLIQSSGAVTSMLVGLGSASVINLSQVMSLLLGTSIGSTFTVQLLSFNVAQFGIPIFTFSFIIFFFSRNKALKRIMTVIMGFGMIFWGLELIGIGTQSLRTAQPFIDFLGTLKDYPIYSILLTAAFTAIVHSSAVTIGLAMSLATSGLLDLEQALFWVYGANIGTTATALVASLGSNYVGKQVAWAHILYKTCSVAIFYFLTPYIAFYLKTSNSARDIANAHTIFNIASAIIFFFFIKKAAQLIEKLIKPNSKDLAFSSKYLKRRDYQSFSVSIAYVERELLRMGDIVYKMITMSYELFKKEDEELEDKIIEYDDRVDLLNKEINLYLADNMDEADQDQQATILRLMSFSTDLESVGDVIDRGIRKLAQKKHNLKLEFTDEAWCELHSLHKKVSELISISLSCFQLNDKDLAEKVIFIKRDIRKDEKIMRIKHLERLSSGDQHSINTSSIYLDALSEYRRIAGLVANHAYNFLKDKDNLYPRREEQ